MVELPAGVSHYSRVKLEGGFVPHVFSTDSAALLVWPVSVGDNVDSAVWNLVAVRNELQRIEPEATLATILLVCSGWVPNAGSLQSQGVQCLNASQFHQFAQTFFSRAIAQSSSECTVPTYKEEIWNDGKAFLDALVAKAKDLRAAAISYLQTVPGWVLSAGLISLFMFVFHLSSRTTRRRPFRSGNGNQWQSLGD